MAKAACRAEDGAVEEVIQLGPNFFPPTGGAGSHELLAQTS